MGAGILGTSKIILDDLSNTIFSSVSRVSLTDIRPNWALLLLPHAKIVPPR